MKQKIKEIFALIFIGTLFLGLTLMMFTLAIIGYNNSHVDLSKVDSCKGYVTDEAIVLKRGKMNLNVFYFRINGTNENFASYNIHQDYSKLVDNIKIGDDLKVYYKKTQSTDYNLDVIQIEKKGKIILPKNEFESKEYSLIYIGIIGGLAMLIIFIKFILMVKSKMNTSVNNKITI